MKIEELRGLVDISCVKTNNTMAELERMVEIAKKYQFCCCFAMPCYTEWLIEQLKDEPAIAVGGTTGFPSGADLSETKLFTAKRLIELGCDEIDMVINVQALKNGDYQKVKNDILPIRDAVGNRILKVIMEIAYLTPEEIRRACSICADCGVDFVKTGTGWAGKATTVEDIRLIRSYVGTSMRIKAAGGVRTLKTIEEMVDAGCSRFGISVQSIENIIAEIEK